MSRIIFKVRNKKTGFFLRLSSYGHIEWSDKGGKVWKRKGDVSMSISEGSLSKRKLREAGCDVNDLEVVTYVMIEQDHLTYPVSEWNTQKKNIPT
jgi:hypothetical protein